MRMQEDDRVLLKDMFWAAVDAAQPSLTLPNHLPAPPRGRTVVIGAGKAAAQMARAFEALWPTPVSGLVVTSYGNAVPCRHIEVLEASHPVPDGAGLHAARRIFETVSGLTQDDLVIALISGGGSSLLASPAPGLSLTDEQTINRALLASGAPIGVMNVLRSQFSTIKAGRLALACAPARVVTLAVSDVPGDNPALISSGPTCPMQGERSHARKLADLYRLDLPQAAAALLAGNDNLVPDPADPLFARNRIEIIASAAQSLDAAARFAASQSITTAILSDSIEGEARDVALVLAGIAKEVATRGRPVAKPVTLLSGGETTVTMRGNGRGGRNSELMLAFAIAIDGYEGISALSADTDGIDGAGDNAGAFVDGTSASRMRQAGIDPLQALQDNDAYSAFGAIGNLFTTGPTGTNVNDFRAIVVR